MTDKQVKRSEFINIPVLQCPINSCDWKPQDLDKAFAAALTHAVQILDRTYPPSSSSTSNAQVKINPHNTAA